MNGKENNLSYMYDTHEIDGFKGFVLSTMHVCLIDDILFNVIKEALTSGMWKKMESILLS